MADIKYMLNKFTRVAQIDSGRVKPGAQALDSLPQHLPPTSAG